MSKYKNVFQTLEKYGILYNTEFQTFVGVDTGALKASIKYEVDKTDGNLIFKWLDYGLYIQPWQRKTGNYEKPGYLDIIDKHMPRFIDDIKLAALRDIQREINKIIRRNNRI